MGISHPAVANLLSAGLYCLLELGICKTCVVSLVGADPVPMGDYQVLIGHLGLKGFLSLGSPHEMSVELVVVVTHK